MEVMLDGEVSPYDETGRYTKVYVDYCQLYIVSSNKSSSLSQNSILYKV